MKNFLAILSFLLVSTFAFSQAYEPENEGWLVDFDEAVAVSDKTGKPIMANFTGSDWCGWCKRLTKTVFSKPEFTKWADENVVLLELDFPKRKQIPAEIQKKNNNLRNAFQVRGYPTVWVFHVERSADGEFNVDPIGKTGYKKSVGEFTGEVDKMMQAYAK